MAFVVCDFAIVFVLLDVLRRTRQGEHWVLAYAWHPLLAIEVAGSGHVDIVGVLLLLISAASLLRRWRAAAAMSFGLAVAVKLLPIVLLPLYWKRVRMRDGVLAAIVVRTAIRTISQSRPDSDRLARHLRAEVSLQ